MRRLLHDVEAPSQLEGEAWERLITERVMARGGWADMRWLLATVGRERLAAYLAARGHRVLPPREVRFWATVCHVPDAEANSWVEEARRREREWRG